MLSLTATVRQALERGRRLPLAFGVLLLAASTASVVATQNTPPEITSATISPAVVDEGQTATVSVTFTDPDPGDLHTVRIHWRDGSPTQVLQLPAGQTSFQVTHAYRDDDSTFGQNFNAQLTVYDRQLPPGSNDNAEHAAQDYVKVPVKVKNVAPQIVDRSITIQKKGGSQVIVEGDVVEPAVSDQTLVTVTWGDPFSPGTAACSMSKEGRHFRCEHAYRPNLQPKTYAIDLMVKDEEGGMDQYKSKVQLP